MDDRAQVNYCGYPDSFGQTILQADRSNHDYDWGIMHDTANIREQQ